MPADEFEIAARRRKFEQILAAQAKDGERMTHLAALHPDREAAAVSALAILDRLTQSGDLEAFKGEMQAWVYEPGFPSFAGFGQMFVNQIVNAASADRPRVAALLSDVLAVPADEADARRKLGELLAYVEEVRKGAHPAPKRALYVASFFWQMEDIDEWPCFWRSAETMLHRLGWTSKVSDLVEVYMDFRRTILDLDVPARDVLDALHWFEDHPWVGLDPALIERCRRAYELRQSWTEGYGDAQTEQSALLLARAMARELRLLGDFAETAVAEAIGRSVQPGSPELRWGGKEGPYRTDAFVRWNVGGSETRPSLVVWATSEGVAVGLTGIADLGNDVLNLLPTGYQLIRINLQASDKSRLTPVETVETSGNYLVGKWYPGDTAIDREDFGQDVIAVAADVQPIVDKLLVGDPGAGAVTPQKSDSDPLATLVKEFIDERGYPSAKDVQHRADREEMAKALTADELPLIELSTLRGIYASHRYGYPGHQANLHRTMRDATADELESYMQRFVELLWGDNGFEERIDRAVTGDLAIKGMGDAVVMKLLAVAHPERFLPIYPYTGDYGKLRMLKALNLPAPPEGLSRGARQVHANDAVRERLDQFFPGDPWGQGQFLYWLIGRETQVVPVADALGDLADRLLVERAFLTDIVELLKEKGQVIFYGPPGTGKTYLARELSRVLAPDPLRRAIVQFHPSMSYEDFFEGYRPDGAEDGQLTYRLTPGPLSRLAEAAEKSPGVPHVMVIDEINRANLPKVLGELLFLLEYRSETIRTTYRPDEGFQLPPDLKFIGTMNTADRSIALVDAALRRRFHFIPFFPNDGPLKGLLRRWLKREGEPLWVADFVDMVNDELIAELGGAHLQIGPSHFMRKSLDEETVRRVWTYNVFPFIEDQLFGEPERVKRFAFESAISRFRKQTALDDAEALDSYEGDATE